MASGKENSESQRLLLNAARTIRLREQSPQEASKIKDIHDLHPLIAAVLAARGFRAGEELRNFLEPSLRNGLPAPAKLLNLEAACDMTAHFVSSNIPIAICCDFDVDGLTAGSLIYHFLSCCGASAKVFVPDRFEDGYGLSERIVREVAQQGFGLIITVDHGTSNLAELELAQSLGLKTIVIDHHSLGKGMPGCDILVNPQQKGCGFADGVLSAAGLAWYFMIALRSKLKDKVRVAEAIESKAYLDLACLGTICDMVPLVSVNRVIAKRGLELLGQTSRAGLIALKNIAGIQERKVSCYDVSFGIGPRINAAGRMLHGEIVVELLTTSSSQKAEQIARKLNRLNTERQETENRVREKALELAKRRYTSKEAPAAIVLWDEDFHTGVVGIVAQRLVDSFYRPTVVLGVDGEDVYKGSVRGIKGINVVETLASVSTHLLKYGGHEGAGGLSLKKKNLNEFAEAFEEECAKRLSRIDSRPFVEADCEAQLSDINPSMVQQLKALAPFGMGNPNPQILFRNLEVRDVKVLKASHLKASLSDGSRHISGLLWRQTKHPALYKGAKVNLVGKPDYNHYGGTSELQATIQAVEEVSPT